VEDYSFHGIETRYTFGDYRFSGSVGGNTFNSAMGKLSVTYLFGKSVVDLYYFFCKRDREFTYPMHAVGFEIMIDQRWLTFYSSGGYEKLVSNLNNRPSHEKLITLSEIIFYPYRDVNFGVNFLSNTYDWEDESEWQLTSLLRIKTGDFSQTLSWRYWNAEIGFDREINLTSSIDFFSWWSLGSYLSYSNSVYGTDYYVGGFQTRIQFLRN
jgi:hypothetical protein